MRHKRGYVAQLDPYTWGGSKAAFVLVDKLKNEGVPIFVVNKLGNIMHVYSELMYNVQAVFPVRCRIFLMLKIEEHAKLSINELYNSHKEFTADMMTYANNVIRATFKKYNNPAHLQAKFDKSKKSRSL